jgi:hypothetical protein
VDGGREDGNGEGVTAGDQQEREGELHDKKRQLQFEGTWRGCQFYDVLMIFRRD